MHIYHDLRAEISIYPNFPHSRVYETNGRMENVRRSEMWNLGRNWESHPSALCQGEPLRSEWQYTLGLITRNYRLLNLDIRHMCAFNQSSGTERVGHNLRFLPVSIPKLYHRRNPGTTYYLYEPHIRHCSFRYVMLLCKQRSSEIFPP